MKQEHHKKYRMTSHEKHVLFQYLHGRAVDGHIDAWVGEVAKDAALALQNPHINPNHIKLSVKQAGITLKRAVKGGARKAKANGAAKPDAVMARLDEIEAKIDRLLGLWK